MLITEAAQVCSLKDLYANSLRYVKDKDTNIFEIKDSIKESYYELRNKLDYSPHFRLNNDNRAEISEQLGRFLALLANLDSLIKNDSTIGVTTNLHPEETQAREPRLRTLRSSYIQQDPEPADEDSEDEDSESEEPENTEEQR